MIVGYSWLSEKMQFIFRHGDQRVAHLPLMDNPIPVTLICLTYALTVKKVGPYLMRNRKPFDLRHVMIGYNLIMVLLSGIVVYNELFHHWLAGSSLACDPVDYSNSPRALRIVYNSYFYFILKFVEFMDTIFFVLRKKNSQISNLHVIHHGLLPFSVWWGAKFVPGGHATFFGFINSFVHMIMYTYYALSAMGPVVQKYLWWKRYLTIFQLVQFVMIGVHSFQLFFRQCDFPTIFAVWIGSHGVLFWFLFTDFYKRAYKKPSKSSGICNNNGTLTTTVTANGKTKASKNGIIDKLVKNDYSFILSTPPPYSDANGNINKIN
ncbi:very long chain fatty acid elongase 7-like [Brevipalpus obovatus]|uniref:very long chain fatty acid elongase 7-like n=1 Tax=Brevipalpus obovatus TaxID=246614 RepID=UPI003D9E295F